MFSSAFIVHEPCPKRAGILRLSATGVPTALLYLMGKHLLVPLRELGMRKFRRERLDVEMTLKISPFLSLER